MKVKTFPLHMTEDFLRKAKEKAKEKGLPLYEWILGLIQNEIKG